MARERGHIFAYSGIIPGGMTKEKRLRALQNQIRRLQHRIEELQHLSNRYSWARLAVIAAGALASAVIFFLGYARFFWLPLFLAFFIFIVIVRYHRRIERSITRHQIWSDIKIRQIARMQLDWAQIPAPILEPETPLELDLDLSGQFSLHRLANTAVSLGGALRLRDWLSTTFPDLQVTIHRQQLVQELAPLSLFRDKLVLNGKAAAKSDGIWRPEELQTWLEQHTFPPSLRAWLLLLGALAALNITLFILFLADIAPPLWQITFVFYAILFLVRSRELGEPFAESAKIRDSLEQLLAVFQQLENYSYRGAPHLKALCAPFLDPSQRPTSHLKRFSRIVNATGIRSNPFFWLFLNALVPWDYYFAYRLDQYKTEMAEHLPGWTDIWFELEALSSLANLSYLNPSYTFPEIVTDVADGDPVLQAREMGHPLIPDNIRVCNDFAVATLSEIGLFTGSNMSGKSTFLRTVGINLILALAGGPVNAQHLSTLPFRLFTCIRISDSVTDGISYFYAEVKCLKALLDALESNQTLPLFYFVDEIFRGTNNRERLIGSRAYIQALTKHPGVGLIATHDLELVQLADETSSIKNYHFTDDVSDGRMVFDYKLHTGPSPTTNALKIMRSEGLPV